jgi:predicted membrane chloride channel (bestrophin family)
VGLKKKYMEDKRIIHGQLMNEHRKLANEIADIKANSYELNEEEKRKVAELQRQQMLIMKKLENLLK